MRILLYSGGRGRETYGLIRSYEGTDLLATSPTQDSTLLLFKERLPGGLWYSGWTDSSVRNDTSVFTVHHSRGDLAKYAEGRVNRTVTTYVGENLLHNAFEVDWSRGLTEPGSSGAGLFDGGQLVGVLSGVTGTCILRGQAFFRSLSRLLFAHTPVARARARSPRRSRTRSRRCPELAVIFRASSAS